ncbi:hypothetical protein PL373_06020 [Tenacibaculum maritimum]|nr:hypothetical protein [Tenacibaculum maritimum]MDB0600707.1 hypothetical protein [Tenacibaculum maritimum]MDB0612690.1 hypothetical protein [Tenacibaculum maritimum]
MKTKNEIIEQNWEELKGGDTVILTKYQFAMIFDYGYEYHKKYTEQNLSLEKLTLSDLHVLEKELSELVESCLLPNEELEELDDNGKKYNKALTEVSLEIEKRIKCITNIEN